MSKKSILLVDDDATLSEVIQKRITDAGYECSWEQDGAKGLAKLRTTKPDLLILDLMMPNMNGYEVLEEMNIDPALSPIPVLVISNSGEPVQIQKILDLNARDFIIRAHFSPEEVIEKITKIIGTPEITPAASEVIKKPINKTTILIIEDDITLSQIASERLRHEGYQVYTVFDGPDGLTVAGNMHPDLILLDIIMPVMNGFEVLKRLKEDPKLKSIPVIIFSNLAQEKDKIRSRELGAIDYLVKANFTPALLVERIARILNNA